MEGTDTYNDSKDVHPRKDAFKQCLNTMHKHENFNTPVSSKKASQCSAQLALKPKGQSPLLPSRKRNTPLPVSMAAFLRKKKPWRGPLVGG